MSWAVVFVFSLLPATGHAAFETGCLDGQIDARLETLGKRIETEKR